MPTDTLEGIKKVDWGCIVPPYFKGFGYPTSDPLQRHPATAGIVSLEIARDCRDGQGAVGQVSVGSVAVQHWSVDVN